MKAVYRGEVAEVGNKFTSKDGQVLVELNPREGQGITHTGTYIGYVIGYVDEKCLKPTQEGNET